MSGFATIPDQLDAFRARHTYRRRRVVDSAHGPVVTVDGRRLLNFCSNDYLGLAADERVGAAFKAGIDRWGAGSGASHLVCGHSRAHHELEEAVAEWTGREAALVFSSGYAANLGVINALLGPGDHVYEDRLNHASLLDGGWLSRAEFHWYAHNDVGALQQAIEAGTARSPHGRHLIASDGTFSMDGDLCRLDDMVQIARARGARLLVDDAHGFGVHGADGCGTVDPARYTTSDVALVMGTFGKALGTAGAFVAGDAEVIDYLVQRARTYIYTTALPAALAEAALCGVKIARDEAWRRNQLREHVARFRAGARARGIPIGESSTPIQPVIVGESTAALKLSQQLEAQGILITAIRPPTVPDGTARLRVTFSAAHTADHVDCLLNALEQCTASVCHGAA